MAHHAIYDPSLSPPQAVVTISGPEAHHAIRVKRLTVGDRVELLDGRGRVTTCRIAATSKRAHEWDLSLDVIETVVAEPLRPRVVVLSAPPKGDRLEAMIDGLSQVGAAAWRPLASQRTVVEPREGKISRLERVAVEALKQCGRPWVLDLGPSVSFEEAISLTGRVVMADATGGSYRPSQSDEVAILVGPEGGWSPQELEQAKSRRIELVRFGPHVMRIETAAVVAAATVLGLESRG
jgi:16S rRNA (uracil1498-N3)-methyltransferase